MAKISLDIPDDLLPDMGSPEVVARELLLAAAMDWCRRGELSTSQAARLVGLTYAEFLEAAVQRKADLYDYAADEIEAELARPLPEGANLEAIKQELARAQAARG
jgi:predicted HTH domain antitoxin